MSAMLLLALQQKRHDQGGWITLSPSPLNPRQLDSLVLLARDVGILPASQPRTQGQAPRLATCVMNMLFFPVLMGSIVFMSSCSADISSYSTLGCPAQAQSTRGRDTWRKLDGSCLQPEAPRRLAEPARCSALVSYCVDKRQGDLIDNLMGFRVKVMIQGMVRLSVVFHRPSARSEAPCRLNPSVLFLLLLFRSLSASSR